MISRERRAIHPGVCRGNVSRIAISVVRLGVYTSSMHCHLSSASDSAEIKATISGPVGPKTDEMQTKSGPVNSAGITAALGIMDVDVADNRVRKHTLNHLLDLRTFNHISVQHHTGLIETTQRK